MTTKKVLIVEDEAIVAMALSRALPRFGYEVSRVFASGEEALASIAALKPDLILMDIHLLGALDGIETAARVRMQHDTPIVFMSGYDSNEIHGKTQHISNATIVGKPVGIATLADVLEQMLANPKT
ncbi:MAG TPA: response regulator [Polyangium sp.]|nr:response regulator [Polyangium sp.]